MDVRVGSVKTFQYISFECYETSVFNIELMFFMHLFPELYIFVDFNFI
mgnify:CR=1 FL=1